MSAVKKVLMLCYFFPPVSGPGALRALKFVKYLPEFNWQPIVLTPENAAYSLRDETLLNQVPADCEVIRAAGWEGRSAPARAWGQLLIPDPMAAWNRRARRTGKERLALGDIDLIYSCSSPLSSHLTAARWRRQSGLPWVADFRDPWTLNYAIRHNFLRQNFEERLERRVFAAADAVVLNTDEALEAYAKKYPQFARKMTAVPNGYDPDDFPDRQAKDGDAFTLTYTGAAYYAKEALRTLVAAVAKVNDEPGLKKPIKLVFTGHRREIDFIPDRLKAAVDFKGYLSHTEAVNLTAGADMVVLAGHPGRAKNLLIPAKTYEYLAGNRPILALTGPGGLRDLLSAFPGCETAAPHDVDGVIKILRAAVSERQAGFDRRSLPGLRAFDRRRLTSRLAAIFNSLTQP